MKLLCVCGLILLTLSCISTQVAYKDCSGVTPVGVINSLNISGCSSSPCKVKQGKNYTITVNFTTTESTSQLFADVHGIVAGVPVEFPLPQKDACEGGKSGINCPIKSGGNYTYVASLPILKAYPPISVIVEWSLNDAKSGGNIIFCFLTPITVIT